jgi:siderophore synthetase component
VTAETRPAADIADELALETLLRCWLREAGIALEPDASTVRFGLPASGLSVRAAVRHRSACGWHRFGPVELVAPGAGAGGAPRALDSGLLAALLVREITAERGLPAAAGADALGRMIDSTRRMAGHLRARQAEEPPADRPSAPFLVAEQASVSGHPFHPAAQAREGSSDQALATYSPERGGSFPLRWFAAHPAIVTMVGSAPAAVRGAHGRGRQCLAELFATLSGGIGAPSGHAPSGHAPSRYVTSGHAPSRYAPSGYLVVPAHPWQAEEVTRQGAGAVAELLADGRLVDLGPAGPPWYATTSLRTVWRPDSPVMLKLSLGLRITNSRRVLQLGELRLAEMVSRLLDAGLARPVANRHPSFHLIGEPGWVAVTHPDGAGTGPGDHSGEGGHGPGAIGLETAVRINPFGPTDRAVGLSALVSARPDRAADSRGRARAAMLPELLLHLADRGHAPVAELALSWFERYLAVLVAPVIDLYLHCGVGVEAHLQNTLLTLDADGWPVAGWYRDSQGYYLATSAADAAERLIPDFAAGLDLVFDEDLVADRVIYYLVVNNVLAVIGALGAAGVAAEHRLLRRVRALLVRLGEQARAEPTQHRPPPVRLRLVDTLLTAGTLPCKGNLRTCVDGRDELFGPVATQSVYVRIPNPLLEAAP